MGIQTCFIPENVVKNANILTTNIRSNFDVKKGSKIDEQKNVKFRIIKRLMFILKQIRHTIKFYI